MTSAIRLLILISFSTFFAALSHGQTMYKSVTPDGRIIYSDKPPVEARVLKTLTVDSAPSSSLPYSAVEQLRKLKASRLAAAPSSSVVLYFATWCGYCKEARAYLASKGIAYQGFDIDTPSGLASYAQAGGGKGIPLLLVGRQRVQGFSPATYDYLFSSRK